MPADHAAARERARDLRDWPRGDLYFLRRLTGDAADTIDELLADLERVTNVGAPPNVGALDGPEGTRESSAAARAQAWLDGRGRTAYDEHGEAVSGFARDVLALDERLVEARRALEHYANEDHWSDEPGDVYTTWAYDGGHELPWKIARAALAATEETRDDR